MAIFNPGNQDLTSDYGNIIDALNKRAAIESKNTGKYGTANAVAEPISQHIQKQATLAQAEDIQKRKEQRDFEISLKKEGRKLFTPEMGKELLEKDEDGDGIPDLQEADIAPFYNTYVKPEEIEKHISQKVFSRTFKTPEEQAAANVAPVEAAKAQFTQNSPFGKLEVVPDKNSETGFTYYQRTKTGEIVSTGLPAPKPGSGTRSSPSLDPKKRADEIRKQYKAVVDKSEFPTKLDAYKGALNALKNVSITNDQGLIYSVARSRDGGGRLSDQDVQKAARSGALGEVAQQSFNRVFNNERELTDLQRQNLVNTVIQNYQNAENSYSEIEKQYNEVVNAEDPEVKTHKPLIDYRQNVPQLKMVKSKKTGKTLKALVYPDGKIEPIK